MTPLERQELERLRVEVRELREELAEWRRQYPDEEPDGEPRPPVIPLDEGEDQVFHRLRCFGLTRAETRLLLFMIARPGIAHNEEQLARVAVGREHASAYSSKVRISRVRTVLRRAGFGEVIETVQGFGWAMARPEAKALSQAWGLTND